MPDTPATPELVMPDLAGVRRTVRHRLDSALLALLRLGVEHSRIVLESGGPGESDGAILAQDPAPGTTLTPNSRVVLRVGGPGGLDMMPFPLRDESETEFRLDRLFAIFDNPALKLGFYLRQGGGYLALHADEPLTARRWLEELLALSAAPWPDARWHALARLLPQLHAIAGTALAVRVAMAGVFQLPVASVRVRRDLVPLPRAMSFRLGQANGRLGFDAMLGGGLVGDSQLEITYGPLSVAQWRAHDTPAMAAERAALLPSLLPMHLTSRVIERWQVGSAADGTRLDDARRPPLLGINAYLGTLPIGRAA
jgi:hypothetical protein